MARSLFIADIVAAKTATTDDKVTYMRPYHFFVFGGSFLTIYREVSVKLL